MEGDVQYTPVPCLCKGAITSVIKDSETYEVSIYSSPLGEMMSPVYCSLVFSPGQEGNYKRGDHVRVMVMFMFGGVERRFIDVFPGGENYILGTFTERSLATIKVDNPVSANDGDRRRFINRNSGAGIVATDSGNVHMTSGGAIYHMLSPMGYGVDENASRMMAQNFHRIVAYNAPFYLAREHFGMYSGSDQNDKNTRVTDEDYPINYRRFVTQTKDPSNFVSTCEGTWAPWLGPNNDFGYSDVTRDVLYTRVVNADKSRLTIEEGEPGDGFLTVRIDDVTLGEKSVPAGTGSTPAIVGNRFKMTISDKGAVDIRAGGQGVPAANFNAFNLKISENGELSILSKGTITLSHGDSDESVNSIVMDPAAGVDITAKNGFRVNGNEVVMKAFIEWMQQNQAQLCQTTSPGAPSPISPAALATFTPGVQKPSEQGGFTSTNVGPPATGIIKDADTHQSV